MDNFAMSMKMSIRSALVCILFLAGCRKAVPQPVPEPGPQENPVEQEKPKPGEYTLPLIETTDIHGYIVNEENTIIHYRLAYIADKVNDIRGNDRDRLLLLDGGDIYQGASFSNLLEGRPVYIAMDIMGYDAVAVGNHEFDWDFYTMIDPDATMPDYEWMGASFVNSVPVLCANLYRNGSREASTKDYVIVEKSAVNADGEAIKVRIGIIGFAIDYAGSIMQSKFIDKGFSIREDYSIANDIARELESTGQCDATVLLIHGAADNAAESLGSSVIDLVLGGHSHTTMTGKTASGIAYLQGGRYAEHFASASLTFTVDADGSTSFTRVNGLKIASVDSSHDLHSVAGQNAADLDDDILAVSEYAVSATSEQSGDVVGYITVGATTYPIDGSGGRSCIMANWMCDIIRRIGEADVAFVNGGGVRTRLPLNGQSKLYVTVSDVYEMFPFNNTTYVYDLSYEELLRVFDYSMTNGGSSLFSSMTGINCYFTDYKVLSLRKDGVVIYQNGKWVDDWASRRVRLAVSEYLATSQRVDNHTGMGNPLIEWNGTSRLLSSDKVDNENAVLVLRAESATSGGHLYIDTATHLIYSN